MSPKYTMKIIPRHPDIFSNYHLLDILWVIKFQNLYEESYVGLTTAVLTLSVSRVSFCSAALHNGEGRNKLRKLCEQLKGHKLNCCESDNGWDTCRWRRSRSREVISPRAKPHKYFGSVRGTPENNGKGDKSNVKFIG